jgi:hypothetical protein
MDWVVIPGFLIGHPPDVHAWVEHLDVAPAIVEQKVLKILLQDL